MFGFCEICKEYNDLLDKHHIMSRRYGGTNKKCYICQNCHRKVHIGQIVIEGRFMTTNGNVIIFRNASEPSITNNEDPKVYIIPIKYIKYF